MSPAPEKKGALVSSALEPISLDESCDLIRLEHVIQQRLQTVWEVTDALTQIRDRRLYRVEHATFDNYCREKWNISRVQAHRLISASAVVDVLPVGNKPTSERQARPLTKLADPGQQREAWQAAVDASGGKPTANHVEAAVEKVKARTSTRTPNAPAKPAKKSADDGDCDPPDTPLRWLTHWWGRASPDERKSFDNFRAGFPRNP